MHVYGSPWTHIRVHICNLLLVHSRIVILICKYNVHLFWMVLPKSNTNLRLFISYWKEFARHCSPSYPVLIAELHKKLKIFVLNAKAVSQTGSVSTLRETVLTLILWQLTASHFPTRLVVLYPGMCTSIRHQQLCKTFPFRRFRLIVEPWRRTT